MLKEPSPCNKQVGRFDSTRLASKVAQILHRSDNKRAARVVGRVVGHSPASQTPELAQHCNSMRISLESAVADVCDPEAKKFSKKEFRNHLRSGKVLWMFQRMASLG